MNYLGKVLTFFFRKVYNVKEKKWVIQAKFTHNFHAQKKKTDKNWRLEDTAKALNRSIGSVSQDLLVAKWLRTHSSRLEDFQYLAGALDWIREYEEKLLETEIE